MTTCSDISFIAVCRHLDISILYMRGWGRSHKSQIVWFKHKTLLWRRWRTNWGVRQCIESWWLYLISGGRILVRQKIRYYLQVLRRCWVCMNFFLSFRVCTWRGRLLCLCITRLSIYSRWRYWILMVVWMIWGGKYWDFWKQWRINYQSWLLRQCNMVQIILSCVKYLGNLIVYRYFWVHWLLLKPYFLVGRSKPTSWIYWRECLVFRVRGLLYTLLIYLLIIRVWMSCFFLRGLFRFWMWLRMGCWWDRRHKLVVLLYCMLFWRIKQIRVWSVFFSLWIIKKCLRFLLMRSMRCKDESKIYMNFWWRYCRCILKIR